MVEKTAADKEKDSQSFNKVAALYNEYRPDYPKQLVDSVIAAGHLPEGARILEIGSGTGKATCLFASRGYAIHCIEPGRKLAAVAARNLSAFPLVTFELTNFEDWPEQPSSFDLVMSAQAFHWVSAEIGYPKAARSLIPGGALALFWNMHPGSHGQVADDLKAIYRKIAPQMEIEEDSIEETIRERTDEITQSGCFGPVTALRFPWSCTYRTREFIGLLSTHSDHIRLPARSRRRLLESIATVIDANGGSIEWDYVAVLYIAQKPF